MPKGPGALSDHGDHRSHRNDQQCDVRGGHLDARRRDRGSHVRLVVDVEEDEGESECKDDPARRERCFGPLPDLRRSGP